MSTLENLQAAFNGESNANARYIAFARKADEDGYGPIASLFRAAAKAEEIHAAKHAEVIRKMNAEPKASIQAPQIKSTRENLEAAIQGETYERDVMYPGFIKIAEAEKNSAAKSTFSWALRVETQHAMLYTNALAQMDSWRGGKKDFFVCTVCGMTVTQLDFEQCPVCSHPRDRYIKVN